MESQDYKFTKSHTEIAKGMAIVLMICHHLFGFSKRLHNVNYISIIPNNNYEYSLGRFGVICVAMFIFLSGYGLYISYIKKGDFTFGDSIKKMGSFMTNYWLVFILFVPIGLIWFNDNTRYAWNFNIFIANFFLISPSYNGEWWFARLYVELLLLFPIIKYGLNKSTKYTSIISILLCIVPLKSDVFFKLFPQLSFLENTLIYKDIKLILLWQAIFVCGCLVAKYDLFKVANEYLMRKKLDKNIYYILIILIIIKARLGVFNFVKIDPIYLDILITPIFILFGTNIISALKIKNIFIILGKNSGKYVVNAYLFYLLLFSKNSILPENISVNCCLGMYIIYDCFNYN